MILKLYYDGVKLFEIFCVMKVLYGCVSKLLNWYQNIGFIVFFIVGGFKLKVFIDVVIDMVVKYKMENFEMFVWEIR